MSIAFFSCDRPATTTRVARWPRFTQPTLLDAALECSGDGAGTRGPSSTRCHCPPDSDDSGGQCRSQRQLVRLAGRRPPVRTPPAITRMRRRTISHTNTRFSVISPAAGGRSRIRWAHRSRSTGVGIASLGSCPAGLVVPKPRRPSGNAASTSHSSSSSCATWLLGSASGPAGGPNMPMLAGVVDFRAHPSR